MLVGSPLVTLRESGEFTFYRGQRQDDSLPVLIVAVSADQPSPQSLKQLEHEYSLAAELDPAWAARPLALTRHEGRTILVLRDPGGEPLDSVLERGHGQPLDPTRFLRIAIGLSAALGQVHRHGLIHRDIKPANVLVDDDGHVWLTGFGIASRRPRERQAPAPPETIAGTLAYIAPEQTGRMNRSVDARSDLYSVGITLYQMLTGALPFAAADPLEWIHCHVARQAAPPCDRAAVPEPLSSLTMKLLAKNAEERYQTASGLEADLRRCLAEWQSNTHIDPFPLGANDASDRLLIPEKLYGRERETGALIAAFDRVVAQGTSELVLVSGYPGVGKSSVVGELHKALIPPRGLFASGKFDQYKRDIPYVTLAQAFESLVRSLLVQSEAELRPWRDALREALGANGQLMVDLVPELELVIGDQPPVPDLAPQEAKNRFQMVFRRFLCVFAQHEHPLALFLDDLQWLDTATLDLLEHLLTHAEVRHLLLVGAYRDNEVTASHPLMRTLEAIRKANAPVHEIGLAPLELNDVDRLIADALHCDLERARPLAHLVHEKTGGNPFFAIQFFIALAEEGLLAFDPAAPAWQWDVDHIRARSYTDNVVELMAGKLRRLSVPTQEALQQLACLGNVVEVTTLTLVHGSTEEAMDADLREAVDAGLVFRQESAYTFLHDRIQQAAYSLIPEGQRAANHLRVGRVLHARMTADGLADHLFDVASHLNRGAALIIEPDEKIEVAAINLRAGRRAKASAAYAAALAHFAAGVALLNADDWENRYELTFNLWLERAECDLLTGNFENAEQLIGALLQRAASTVDQAAVSQLKVLLHLLRSENQQAVDSALTCLRLFDIHLSAHPTWEQVQDEYEMVWRNLGERQIESLTELPLMNDPDLQAAMRLLSALEGAAYFTDFNLYCLHLCRMVNISMQHGTSSASAPTYGWLGTLLGPVFHRYADGYRFAKLACDLIDKHGFLADRAKAHNAMGMVVVWTESLTTAIDFNRAAIRTATQTGDLTYACFGTPIFLADLLLRNDPLDAVWRELERALDYLRGAKYDDVVDAVVSQQRFVATMQGKTATLSTFSDAQFDEAAFEARLQGDRMPTMICWYWILKLKSRFLSGDYSDASAAGDRAKALLWASVGQVQMVDYCFYSALTIAALYGNASQDERQGWDAVLAEHCEQLREWADTYPPTFGDKHALVSAEVARLEGRDPDAMRLYEQAIQLAREHGFVQNEALAHEVTARFYLARGLETIGHACLRNARNCYDRWGALGKVKQLNARYPQLHEERAPNSLTATIGTLVGQLDLETVVKASQALSSEIVLPTLIETLMRIAVEHAGAERGLLILLRGDEPQIEAKATTGHGRPEVIVRQTAITASDLPQSALHYVIRTRERVVLDDAAVRNSYSDDEYLRLNCPRSVLCLPIIKQTKLVGAFYLENNLTPRAFTSDRIAVLEMLASQAAISLENARLYSDLQRSEAVLAQGQSLSHTGSFGWSVLTGAVDWSDETYNIFEHDRSVTPTVESVLRHTHPEDRDLVRRTLDRASRERTGFDIEHRLLMPDGRVKHVRALARASTIVADDLEFVGAVTDATEQRLARAELERAFEEITRLKDRLQDENVALREEVDNASMFEEIVGTSPPLRAVLSRVSKVAPSDSSVLITGETGTGKELVARAIHRHSRRSSGAFVSVNCAAIPRDLIASELFGHEKGAFTGATQRRLGRFELADGGTIFLDEIGELPAATQIVLLHVLQEHEFERLGGERSIRSNVRVIAATNRDLEAAINNGLFRSDLFYRLNVFPIEMPSLRERREDIPLLVEYFIDRYSRKAGKRFRTVNKRSLDLLQSYAWPGNIRELQNVIERSVIVCESESFAVDESWLSGQPGATEQHTSLNVLKTLPSREKALIEGALKECGGRVYGPSGAAAKLGVPRSTLESKIRLLKINKNRFKPTST